MTGTRAPGSSEVPQGKLTKRAVKCHLLAVYIVTKLAVELGFVRFNNLKVTCWDQTIACDNHKTRRHLMASILFVVRPFLLEFARLV